MRVPSVRSGEKGRGLACGRGLCTTLEREGGAQPSDRENALLYDFFVNLSQDKCRELAHGWPLLTLRATSRLSPCDFS